MIVREVAPACLPDCKPCAYLPAYGWRSYDAGYEQYPVFTRPLAFTLALTLLGAGICL